MAEDDGSPVGPRDDDDLPATRGFVRAQLERFATKADIERFATKEDLRLLGVRLEHLTDLVQLILERVTDLIQVKDRIDTQDARLDEMRNRVDAGTAAMPMVYDHERRLQKMEQRRSPGGEPGGSVP